MSRGDSDPSPCPEYETTWRGEAEIGAWEIASGCARHYAAWFLNSGALVIGWVIAPRRTFRAFVRGRSSGNLYRTVFTDELPDRRIGELRNELRISDQPIVPTAIDVASFVAWSVVAAGISLLPYIAYAAVAVILVSWFRA